MNQNNRLPFIFQFFSLGALSIAIIFRVFLSGLTVDIGENALVSLFVLIAFCMMLCADITNNTTNKLPIFIFLPIVWILYCLSSSLWSHSPVACLSQCSLWGTDILLFFTVYYWSREKEIWQYIASLIMAVLFVEITYSLYQYYIGLPSLQAYIRNNPNILDDMSNLKDFILTYKINTTNVSGHFTNDNSLGAYLLLYIPIFLKSCQNKQQNIKIKITFLLLCILTIFVLSITGSRASFLSLFLAISISFLYFLYKTCKRMIFMIVTCSIFLGSCCFSILVYYTNVFHFIGKRLISFVLRIGYWITGIQLYKDSPILGIGVNNYTELYPFKKLIWTEESKYIHNGMLQMLVETGIIGFVLYATIIYFIVRLCFQPCKEQIERQNPSPFSKKYHLSFATICFILVGILLHNLKRLFDTESLQSQFQQHTISYIFFIFLICTIFFFFLGYWIATKFSTFHWKKALPLSLLAFFIHHCLDININEPTLCQQIAIFIALLLNSSQIQHKTISIHHGLKLIFIAGTIIITIYVSTNLLPQLLQISNAKQISMQQYSEKDIEILHDSFQQAPWEINLAIKLSQVYMKQLQQKIKIKKYSPQQIQQYFYEVEKILETSMKYNKKKIALQYNLTYLYFEQSHIWEILKQTKKQKESLQKAQKKVQNMLEIYKYATPFFTLAREIENKLGNKQQAVFYYKQEKLARIHRQCLSISYEYK